MLLLICFFFSSIWEFVSATTVDVHCQQELDAWCNQPEDKKCITAITKAGFSLPLYARKDTDIDGGIKQWRCYSGSSLTPDYERYSNGSAYCTRSQLDQILQNCCQQVLDSWCNGPQDQNCIDAITREGFSLPLYARNDTDIHGDSKQWRCYSGSSITPNHSAYSNGSAYCTRPQLISILEDCTQDTKYIEVFPAEGTTSVYCYRIPILVVIGNILIAFAEGRINSCGDGGPKHLSMRKSIDNGQTWDPIHHLVTDNSTDPKFDGLNLGSAVYVPSTGLLIVHYVVGSHSLKIASSYYFQSSDAGETWTKPIDITTDLTTFGVNMFAGGPGTGVQLPNGRLIVAGWYNWCCGQKANLSDTGSAVIISDDGGLSWKVGGKIPKTANYHPNEAQVAWLKNGTLIVNSRNAAGHNRILSYSDDQGESFYHTLINNVLLDPTCQGSTINSADGTTLYFSNAHNTHSRTNGTIMKSVDGGASWNLVTVVDPGDWSYSGLTLLNPHALAVIWEGRSMQVRFTIINV